MIILFSKLYCESCLFSVFNEKITEIIQKNAHWKCPFKKKICKCKHCLKNRENEKNGVSSNITSENKKIKSEKIEHQISQAQQYTRAKNVQKLKGFIEFNGNLMLKFSKSMKSLNAQEIMYYHNIIYESLKKLESIVFF